MAFAPLHALFGIITSLEELSRHSGLNRPHKDGWGIAYYEDGDVRLIKEPFAASESACLRFAQDHPYRSSAVVGHIRRATQGRRTLANTQPFARELGGRMHVFAHNGDLDSTRLRKLFRLGAYHPVGESDSEYAFCALLEMFTGTWREARHAPPVEIRFELLAKFASCLRALGSANFVYADGDAIFAHGHRRTHGDGIRPPGMHLLH